MDIAPYRSLTVACPAHHHHMQNQQGSVWASCKFLDPLLFAGRGFGVRGRGAFASRGGARGRGRGRGAGHSTLTREQLDNQLDDYMSKTKGYLDAELDAYMAQADDME